MGYMLEITLEQAVSSQASIEVFGLGYVGFPLAVQLSSRGYLVRGIDVNRSRISSLENNELHESELLLEKDFLESRRNNTLQLDTKSSSRDKSKIGMICVPTPIPNKDTPSDVFVNSAVNDFLGTAKKGDVIVIESSVELGTIDNVKKIIEDKGFEVGVDFGLSFCPERIDPKNRMWNLENIPRIIYCSDDLTFEIAKRVYHSINNSDLVRVSEPKVAETVKSFENTFRLVNISLVNELAILCDHLGISVSEVIDAAATKPFGFIPFYPGAGAGGHCIPKDPMFLLESSKKFGLEFNTVSNALRINSLMPDYICDSISQILGERNLQKSVLVCGMSYKQDMEDMRDSPGFKILHKFMEMGFECAVYDPYFKSELLEKYLDENHITDSSFGVLSSLDCDLVEGFSCMCIVQHHSSTKSRLNEMYVDSVIPVIYDCQSNLAFAPNSSSLLKSLGS